MCLHLFLEHSVVSLAIMCHFPKKKQLCFVKLKEKDINYE